MITVTFDDYSAVHCETIEEVKEEILNALSEQTFPEYIEDDEGNEYGCTWDLTIERL